ncbi:MAG: hypothetical protein ABR587_05445 [Candidatus Binatia bacterium]
MASSLDYSSPVEYEAGAGRNSADNRPREANSDRSLLGKFSMRKFLTIGSVILLTGLAQSSFAIDVPAEARVDRGLVKKLAKDAEATTVTFRLYVDEDCSTAAFGSVSLPLSDLSPVQRIKNEALKNDPTPAPKEEWVLSGTVPVPSLPSVTLGLPGNVFATATLDNGGTPVVSSCQKQNLLTVPESCGDGFGAGDEECDGSDFRGQTCDSLASIAGALTCTPECTIDTTACGDCPGDGVLVAEECWYLAAPFVSCTSTCAANGLPYSSLTRTFTGSDGTLAHCFEVLDALGYTSPPASNIGDYSSSEPVGCLYDPGSGGSSFRVRITDPAPTTADAVDPRLRVCGCQY